MSLTATSHYQFAHNEFVGMSHYQKLLYIQSRKVEANPLFCTTCRTQEYVVEDYSQGCMVCRGCGVVVQNQLISTDEEQRNFQNDDGVEDKSRTSKANSNELLDGDLETSIARVPGQSGQLVRTQMKINETTEKSESTLKTAFSEISRFVELVGATPKSAFTIQQIFKALYTFKKVNSKNLKSSIGACLYKGLKIEGSAITIKEVCVHVKVSEKKLNRMVMQLGKIDSLKELLAQDTHSPKSFIETIAQKLSLPTKILSFALDICERALSSGVDAGKSPSTVAAACIVFASQNHKDQQHVKSEKDVEAISGITRETIRKAVKDFNMHKQSLLKINK